MTTWRRGLLVAAVAISVLASLALALLILPPLLVPGGRLWPPQPATNAGGPPGFADLAKAESDVRGNLIAGLGLLAVTAGAIVGALNLRHSQRVLAETQRQNRETSEQNRAVLEIQRRGQITERFAKAIEQLGESEDDKLDVRLGAIYALEQIAHDSAELHWPIMEVLTAHLRHYRKRLLSEMRIDSSDTDGGDQEAALPPETIAIATVIGRRRTSQDPGRLGLDLHDTDLSNVHWNGAQIARANLHGALLAKAQLEGALLQEADLSDADLTRAYLLEARLTGTNLGRAQLMGADLTRAHLTASNLCEAKMEGADLWGAVLEGAYLGRSDLRGADLSRAFLGGAELVGANLCGAELRKANLTAAHLEGANLDRVDLTEVSGLTWAQVKQALNVDESSLPAYLLDQRPDHDVTPSAEPSGGQP